MSQTAIVMGATSGMGLRVAQLLLERGWTVGAAGRRLNELQQLQDRYPDRVKIQVIDVTAADAPQRLQELIRAVGYGRPLFPQFGLWQPKLRPEGRY